MFDLLRLLRWAARITWKRSSTTSRRALKRARKPTCTLGLEEMEGRIVPSLMGQQLFPSDNPWNQNISNAPVAANSAAIISHIGTSIHLHPDWYADNPANGSSPLYGIPFNIVHGNSTAKVNVAIDNYPGESNVVPVPIPANAVIEGDYQNGPNLHGGGYNSGQRGDSHLIVWDEDTNTAYELFGVTRPADPTLFPNTSGVELAHTDGMWHAAQETVWNMNTDTFRTLGATSADAAGLSILAGLARPDEGLTVAQGGQGVINHALRVTLPGGDVNPQYIYPASHMVSESQGANNLPLGGRLRLQNTPAVNALIASMPPESQIVARAMQQYGLIVADIGTAMYIGGTSATVDTVDSPHTNLVWDLNDIFASNGLEALNAGDFEVVNLQPKVTGLSATSGSAGATVTVTGQNFSGAAGNLSVFFGSTAATSVTFVSDTKLTAVVPSGSGTVNVTVQAGVIEADHNSSNPNANVNGAIFGYGTSAITTADQFIYSSQSASGPNSTDSWASPTVASGSSDTLTLAIKDASGNPVSGLASSAFSFALSVGSSAGSFGSVASTATPGKYTTTFTGTTAGTASTVTATVNGSTLSTQPTITVTAGAISGANSTVRFASPSIASGNTDLVTLVVKDAAGNPISGLSSNAFGFSLMGGTSAGAFGPVIETTTKGTYTATFTATSAGTASTLTTTVSGVSLTSSPATVAVTSGVLDLSKSTVAVSSSILQLGSTTIVTLTARDVAGNPLGSGGATVAFALSNGSRGDFLGLVTDNGNGTYIAMFAAGLTSGTNTITTTINNQAVTSPNPSVSVTSLPITLTGSTLTITGTPGNDTFYFTSGAVQDSITLNGVSLAVDVATVSAVVFQGNGGNDTAYLIGSSSGTNTLNLSPFGGTLSGSNYSVTASAVNTIWAYGHAGDSATLIGSSSGDVYVSLNTSPSSGSYAYIRSATYAWWNYAVGFGTVLAHPAASGTDTGMAYEYDLTGQAAFVGHQFSGVMSGPGFTYTVNNFQQVIAIGKPGSADRADLYAAIPAEVFFAYPAYGVMTNPNVYYNYAFFGILDAHGCAAGGNNAFLLDNVGGANFTGTSAYSEMTGTNYDNRADAFAGVYVYNQTSQRDTAHVSGSPNHNYFSGYWLYL